MTLSEATILVVDDEPILRMTFTVLLRQSGATVHTAANGDEALQVLEREHIDAMLTDRQMPVMDGKTLLKNMLARTIQVPSMLFVNGVEAEDAAELERLGVVETVTKPLHPEDLLAMLTRVLEPLPARR